MPTYRMHEDDVMDFGFDWSDWLASGETISSSAWTVPSGITTDNTDNSTTQTSIWLSSPTAGQSYNLANKITTSSEREKVRYLTIIGIPPSYNLITLNELKNYPGLSSVAGTEEPILESLIAAATKQFERYWETYGVQRGISEEIITYRQIRRDTPDASLMELKKRPIQSVVSIEDPDGNTIDSGNYWTDEMRGLKTTGGWTIPQDSNGFQTYWMVTYSGGWVANAASVPDNIKTACKMWVASLYRNYDRNVLSKKVGDLSITYRDTTKKGDLPDYIKSMISEWRIIEV